MNKTLSIALLNLSAAFTAVSPFCATTKSLLVISINFPLEINPSSLKILARILATVVLPVPGFPEKIK